MILAVSETVTTVLLIVLPIVGLLIGAGVVFFIPYFKKQRDEVKGGRIVREAEIKADNSSTLNFISLFFEIRNKENDTSTD